MTTTAKQLHYFSPDGQYGGAEGLQIIDTTNFTDDSWDEISALPDRYRVQAAAAIAANGGELPDDIDELEDPGFDPEPGAIDKLRRLVHDMEADLHQELELTMTHAAYLIREAMGWTKEKE